MNKKYIIRNIFLLMIKNQLNRLFTVSFFSVLYLSHVYADQLLESSLTRRPLQSVRAERLLEEIYFKGKQIPIVQTYRYSDCSDRGTIILKQVNRKDVVSIVSIAGRDYPIDALPSGVTYGLLSLKESGGQYGAVGLVIDQKRYSCSVDAVTKVILKGGSSVEEIPTEGIMKIVNMERVSNNCCGYSSWSHGVYGKSDYLAQRIFQFSLSRFNNYDNKQILMDNPGKLVDIKTGWRGFSYSRAKAIYLNRLTGFDLSSLENIDTDQEVTVFLDQNMGNIRIDSTVVTPKGLNPYGIVFMGVNTFFVEEDRKLHQDFFRLDNPYPTTIEYDGGGAFINCKNSSACGIYNINLKVNNSTDVDSTSMERKLVYSPYGYSFYMYLTKDSDGVTKTYAYESDSFTRYVSVHGDVTIGNIKDMVCKECAQSIKKVDDSMPHCDCKYPRSGTGKSEMALSIITRAVLGAIKTGLYLPVRVVNTLLSTTSVTLSSVSEGVSLTWLVKNNNLVLEGEPVCVGIGHSEERGFMMTFEL